MAKKRVESICIYDNDFFLFENNQIYHIDKIKKDTDFCGLIIPANEIYHSSFTLPSDIEEDRFSTSVEIALFENGKLDIQNSYIIGYKRNLSDSGEVWVVEAFAVEENRIYNLYSHLVEEIKYIDLIAIPYLVYEAYFFKNTIEYSGIKLIIHLEDKNSFIAIYRDSKYIAHQKIYSLEYISKKVGVSLDRLKEILIQKGVDGSKYIESEKDIFKNIYTLLFDIIRQTERLIRSKSAYFDFSKIDSIVIDFYDREILGFDKIIDDYGLNHNKVETLYFKDIKGCQYSFDCIKKLYIKYVYEQKLEAPNLSPFLREPPLWSMWIGRLIIALFLTLALSVGYGLYMEYQYNILSQKYAFLSNEVNNIEKEIKSYKNQIKQKKEILTAQKQRLSKTKKDIMKFTRSLNMAIDIKEFALLRQKMMKDVDIVMKKYSLMALSMEQNGSSEMKVDLVVPFKKRDSIALFMKDMKNLGYKSVTTDEIILDKNLYKSSVKISR